MQLCWTVVEEYLIKLKQKKNLQILKTHKKYL